MPGREAASDPRDDDRRDRDEHVRERDRDSRDRDPRDLFLEGLELPRGLERDVVIDGDHRYELNGEESRAPAAVGAFRVIAEGRLSPSELLLDGSQPDRTGSWVSLAAHVPILSDEQLATAE